MRHPSQKLRPNKGTFVSRSIGQEGEALAADYLVERGFDLLCKNFRNRFGEIDLIVKKDNITVFVEVKFRRDEGYGMAIDFITKKKLQKILKTAKFYLSQNDLSDTSWRVDAIAIDGETKEIEWVENIYTKA